MRWLSVVALAVSALVTGLLGPGAKPAAAAPVVSAAEPGGAPPLFAFYYLWFDPSSWNRAKIDVPLLGKYSSDDPRVLRQHIEWAKSAGIDGFIVSWKDTSTNDRRLRLLMTVAKQENFKLAMIYQGLDFSRKPLDVRRVQADFVTFRDQFASDPVFYRMGGKPLTIWSGTWAYSATDVAAVTSAVRQQMLVLSTEKSVKGYQRLAAVTDGDAYYWSSVNPDSNRNYAAKLNAMSQTIHQDGKYWIAPFAPGFDARKVGGAKVVERASGQTLRVEYATAVRSSPDALGLISWNEFSENSYIEPSKKYGTFFLDLMRNVREAPGPRHVPDDSSQPTASKPGSAYPSTKHGIPANLVLLVSFVVILAVGGGVFGWVRRRRSRPVVR